MQLCRVEAEGEEVVEFDDWLLDFAELFREHLGIDADGHVDLHNEGLEKCNLALEAAVRTTSSVPSFSVLCWMKIQLRYKLGNDIAPFGLKTADRASSPPVPKTQLACHSSCSDAVQHVGQDGWCVL